MFLTLLSVSTLQLVHVVMALVGSGNQTNGLDEPPTPPRFSTAALDCVFVWLLRPDNRLISKSIQTASGVQCEESDSSDQHEPPA